MAHQGDGHGGPANRQAEASAKDRSRRLICKRSGREEPVAHGRGNKPAAMVLGGCDRPRSGPMSWKTVRAARTIRRSDRSVEHQDGSRRVTFRSPSPTGCDRGPQPQPTPACPYLRSGPAPQAGSAPPQTGAVHTRSEPIDARPTCYRRAPILPTGVRPEPGQASITTMLRWCKACAARRGGSRCLKGRRQSLSAMTRACLRTAEDLYGNAGSPDEHRRLGRVLCLHSDAGLGRRRADLVRRGAAHPARRIAAREDRRGVPSRSSVPPCERQGCAGRSREAARRRARLRRQRPSPRRRAASGMRLARRRQGQSVFRRQT